MSGLRLSLVFVALLAVFLLATLPLRLVLDGGATTARLASGSLWHGRLEAAAWHGITIGDVDLGLAPLPLLIGTRQIDFATASLSGRIGFSQKGSSIERFAGTAAPGQIGGLPITNVRFGDFGAVFDKGRCTTAGGTIAIEAGGQLANRGAFSGTVRCDGDRLLLPLQGEGGRLDLHLTGDGAYAATITIDAVDPAARPALLASGFQATPTGLALILDGEL